MKRGQFETMGLAIILVLLVLGMTVFLFFNLREPGDAAQRYRDQQLAQNTIDALLATTVAGCPIDVADLIEDVVVRQRNPCSRPSREILYEITSAVLQETLDVQDHYYVFQIREDTQGAAPVYERTRQCDLDDPKVQTERPGLQPITLYPSTQTYMVLLYLCYT